MNYEEFIKDTILKHYKSNSRELCGQDVYKFIDREIEKTKRRGERYKRGYTKTMDKVNENREKIENEYESYFCFYNNY